MATQREIADHLCFKEIKSIGNLIRKGILPGASRSGLDPDECRKAYITYLRAVRKGQTEPIVEDEEKENFSLLLEKEKWREKKRQNDESENLIAPLSLMQEAIEKTGKEIIQILDSLVPRLKRNWPDMTGEQAEFVNKTVIKCRQLICELEIKVDE